VCGWAAAVYRIAIGRGVGRIAIGRGVGRIAIGRGDIDRSLRLT